MTHDYPQAVPNLTTALSGPLQQLESDFLVHQGKIETWLRHQWRKTAPPFYASVDLRNAGFKLAPIDTNLFPAGFNNLNNDFLPLCIHAVQSAIEHTCPSADHVLIIPERHTRNPHYFASIAKLCTIIDQAGFSVRIGTLEPTGENRSEIILPNGEKIVIDAVSRIGNRLITWDDFDPCMILLNNDLTAGAPPILKDIEQTILPPLQLGWSQRLKSNHFARYQQVAAEFSQIIDIDPWLIDPLFRNCGEINFMKGQGADCLAHYVEILLQAIRKKYAQYEIKQKPFVIIKADAGTYGMGVMTVYDSAEVHQLNRKQRKRMATTKDGKKTTEVILQEGVYTFETWNEANATAEPVVYLIDRFVVGGFYRVHNTRASDENLNTPGMYFQPLAFAQSCVVPNPSCTPDAQPNRFYAYGVVARLALLAAARELAEL